MKVDDGIGVGERTAGNQEKSGKVRFGSLDDSSRFVRDSHSGEVPESEHEPILLVEHIDRLRDALFSLAARVDVETRRENHEREVLERSEDRS